jgi:hypothetical protein
MSTSKIRIKLGAIEVEYEGSEAFLKEELPALLAAVAELHQKSGGNLTTGESSSPIAGQDGTAPNGAPPGAGIQMTTGAIASRLQVKSGPELIIAAAANLVIVQNQVPFSRKRLIEQMRSATAFFKENYVSNLSKALQTLLKEGKLNESSKDMFALTHACEQELRVRLA